MTLKKLAHCVADRLWTRKPDAERIVREVFKVVGEELLAGGTVTILGFGTLRVTVRRSHLRRTKDGLRAKIWRGGVLVGTGPPMPGRVVKIPPRKFVLFRAFPSFRRALQNSLEGSGRVVGGAGVQAGGVESNGGGKA